MINQKNKTKSVCTFKVKIEYLRLWLKQLLLILCMLFSVLRPSKTSSLHKLMGILRTAVKDGFFCHFCFELLSCCVQADALQTPEKKIQLHSFNKSFIKNSQMSQTVTLHICRGIQTEVSLCDPEISGGNIRILKIFFNVAVPHQLPSRADLTSRNLKVAKPPRTDLQLSEAPRRRSGCSASPRQASLISFSL